MNVATQALDFDDIAAQLAEANYALTAPLLGDEDCARLAGLYQNDGLFRSTITMSRHGFGRGEYRYFSYPLPEPVQVLRQTLYPGLAQIANRWATDVDKSAASPQWPARLDELLTRCHEAGQTRPTPLMLRYGAGDFNCLHQDLYGEIHFPLQAILLLDRPGIDFTGGELVLVETRPRQQSRADIVPIVQGQIAIIPVRERPRNSKRGAYRTQIRHGVSPLRSGLRRALGVIFHDAH